MLPDSAEKPDDSSGGKGTEARLGQNSENPCVGRPPGKRLKTSETNPKQLALFPERSSAAKPDTNERSCLQPIAEPEISSLRDLQARLECKASDPCVQDFLGNLRSYEAWRGSSSPPHHVRDAMLRIATQVKVAGGWLMAERKPDDVVQDLLDDPQRVS